MPRILALDYGGRRTGIAVTDPLQIIATALATVETSKLSEFLEKYITAENIEVIVIGKPMYMDGTPNEIEEKIRAFITALSAKFPSLHIARQDERYTSKQAMQSLIDTGLKKKDRKNKANLDSASAVLILQTYLDTIKR